MHVLKTAAGLYLGRSGKNLCLSLGDLAGASPFASKPDAARYGSWAAAILGVPFVIESRLWPQPGGNKQ